MEFKDAIDIKNMSEEEMLDELDIHVENAYDLEQELKSHARKAGKYVVMAAQATKKVDELSMSLEVLVAQIVEELCKEAEEKGKPIPPSAISEIRRSKVPLDKRYQIIKSRLINAQEEANILNGLVYSWGARSKRLTEVARLVQRSLWEDPKLEDRVNSALD